MFGVLGLDFGDTDGLEKFDTFRNGRKEVNLPYVQYNTYLPICSIKSKSWVFQYCVIFAAVSIVAGPALWAGEVNSGVDCVVNDPVNSRKTRGQFLTQSF